MYKTYVESLKLHELVIGISLCGSARLKIDDEFSDIDIWVFLDNDFEISETNVIDYLSLEDMGQEMLYEGRDESLVPYVVLNFLVDERILNLKVLNIREYTDFCLKNATLDMIYLENLENYYNMELLFDRNGDLLFHRKVLELNAISKIGGELIHEMIQRYASFYWRSVYQGVVRDELLAWKNLMYHLIESLIHINQLVNDQLPTAKKWVFSPRILNKLIHGDMILDLIKEVNKITDYDKKSVIMCYVKLCSIENEVLVEEYLNKNFWWRKVFKTRLRSLNDKNLDTFVTDYGGLFVE